MGQKVDPRGFRLGIIRDWESTWFAEKKKYATMVFEDYKLRKYITENLKKAGVAAIKIKRRAKQVDIDIFSARPGMLIGKGGAEVEEIRKQLGVLIGRNVQVNILEQPKSDMNAVIVAESIASQLERRMPFRQVMKRSVSSSLKAGAKGVRICCAGRLAGAEIARTEWYKEGRVPLHTLRSDIDYAKREAQTTYGKIGIKVWIYKGDILDKRDVSEDLAKYEIAPEISDDVTT